MLAFLLAILGGTAIADTLARAQAALASGDLAEARRIAIPLVETGEAEALAILGATTAPDQPERALALLETAAAVGSVTAQLALGRAYLTGGLGLTADPVRAAEFYDAAAAQGSAAAEVTLIEITLRGHLGDPDLHRIRTRLEALVEAREPGARVALARVLAEGQDGAPDPARARRLAVGAAETDEAGALRLLGLMQLQGVGGAAEPSAGLATLRRAAATDAAAANDLGVIFRDGQRGVTRDVGVAADWFETALNGGDGWAALNLARLLSDGALPPADDPVRAATLFALADRRGVAAASHASALRLWDGIGVAADAVAARAAMERAVTRGFTPALNDLGAMVEAGVGGPADPARALSLYRQAADAGDALGAWNLAERLLDMGSPRPDRIEGLAWCLWAAARITDGGPDCGVLGSGLTDADREEGRARLSSLRQGAGP